MKCDRCRDDFEEKNIEESHDVPCYLFYDLISRRERKNQADKFKRRLLCKKCHQKYEKGLNDELKKNAVDFGEMWFNGQ